MKTLEESVVDSLDGSDNLGLYPYLPYLLQDLWEMGSDPNVILQMIRRSFYTRPQVDILDLGCGKGAVAVKLARELNCYVTGVDAVPDFIMEARNFATQFQVHKKCNFLVDDIRQFPLFDKQWDIVILGAIGNVMGDLFQTLTHVKQALLPGGAVVLDDAYVPEGIQTDYTRALQKQEFYEHISRAGFIIEQEMLIPVQSPLESSKIFLNFLIRRVEELIRKEPAKEKMFLDYLHAQQYETRILSDTLVVGTWLLKKD